VPFGEQVELVILLLEVSVELETFVYSENEFNVNGALVPVPFAAVTAWMTTSGFSSTTGRIDLMEPYVTAGDGRAVIRFPARIITEHPNQGIYMWVQAADSLPTARFIPSQPRVFQSAAVTTKYPVQAAVVSALRVGLFVNVKNPVVTGDVSVRIINPDGSEQIVPSGAGLTVRVLDSTGRIDTTGATNADSRYELSHRLPLQTVRVQVSGQYCPPAGGGCIDVSQTSVVFESVDFGQSQEVDVTAPVDVFGTVRLNTRRCGGGPITDVAVTCQLYDEANAPVNDPVVADPVTGVAIFTGVIESSLIQTTYSACCEANGYRVGGDSCIDDIVVEKGQQTTLRSASRPSRASSASASRCRSAEVRSLCRLQKSFGCPLATTAVSRTGATIRTFTSPRPSLSGAREALRFRPARLPSRRVSLSCVARPCSPARRTCRRSSRRAALVRAQRRSLLPTARRLKDCARSKAASARTRRTSWTSTSTRASFLRRTSRIRASTPTPPTSRVG
jgi:hypothetical protein